MQNISRFNTNSCKWNVDKSVLSASTADLDFSMAPEITNALSERMKHEILGVSYIPEQYFTSFIEWQQIYNNYPLTRQQVLFVTTVTTAIIAILRHALSHNQGVILPTPSSNKFITAINQAERILLESPLIRSHDGQYHLDFSHIATLAPHAGALIFCHPHNPTGRLWTYNELHEVIQLCKKHQLILISNEIYADFSLDHCFIPFPSIPAIDHSIQFIALHSPEKTFNINHNAHAFAIIPNKKFRAECAQSFYKMNAHTSSHILSIIASIAAYHSSRHWFVNIKKIISYNQQLIAHELARYSLPIRISPHQATFVMWLDFHAYAQLFTSPEALSQSLYHDAHVNLSNGTLFAPPNSLSGAWFMRLCLGTYSEILQAIIHRIAQWHTSLIHQHGAISYE